VGEAAESDYPRSHVDWTPCSRPVPSMNASASAVAASLQPLLSLLPQSAPRASQSGAAAAAAAGARHESRPSLPRPGGPAGERSPALLPSLLSLAACCLAPPGLWMDLSYSPPPPVWFSALFTSAASAVCPCPSGNSHGYYSAVSDRSV